MTADLPSEFVAGTLTYVNRPISRIATLATMCSSACFSVTRSDFSGPEEAAVLVRQAKALVGLDSSQLKLLKGKKLALISTCSSGDRSCEFTRAATELGAHVSFVHLGLNEKSSAQQIEATAHVLERLYDAVECQHVSRNVTRELARLASIPVFEGLGTPSHPTARLAEMLPGELSPALRRRAILQAALLLSVA